MPLKGILIVGEDPKNHKVEEFDFYKGNPDYLIIDASQELMTQEEFKTKLAGHEIDSNTRIDIWAHGGRENETMDGKADHSIALLSDAGLTKDVLGIIAEHAGNKPIQTHLWSCYGGTAASAVENLPEGSIVMGHGPERSVTYLETNVMAIKKTISSAIRTNSNNMSQVGQDLINNLPEYILQDLNIGIKAPKLRVETFHLDEASTNLSKIESIRSVFNDYNSNIISAIKFMKERGVLSKDIETPVSKAYDDETIRTYEYKRNLFDLFLRKNDRDIAPGGVDFSKILRDGVLISTEEARNLDLGEREKELLNPEFQKKLLSTEKGKHNYLRELLRYSDATQRNNGIQYLVSVAKKNNLLGSYLKNENDINIATLFEAINNSRKSTLYTVLSSAMNLEEKKQMSRLLIENGASITKKYVDVNKTPLDAAKASGLDEFVLHEKQNYRMRRAIKENRSVIKESMLGRFKGDPNGVDSDDKSMVSYAIEAGNLKALKKLIDMGADVNQVCLKNGQNPLYEAAKLGNAKIYDMLVEAGATMNGEDRSGNTPLLTAASKGNIELTEFLIGSGVSINETNERGETVLLKAIENSASKEFIEFLMDKGADINSSNDAGESPLHLLSEEGRWDVVKLLLDKGVDVNSSNEVGNPSLKLAIESDNLNIVKSFVQNGANAGAGNDFTDTPLISAILHGNLDIISTLANDTNVNLTGIGGNTPLTYAIETDNIDIIKILIDNKVDVNACGKYSDPPLILAIKNSNLDIVNMLINNDANVNKISEESGMSPLHEAAKIGNREIYNILLEAGGDPNLLDKKGKRPLDYIERPSVVASSMRSNLEVGAKRASPSPVIGAIETKTFGHSR